MRPMLDNLELPLVQEIRTIERRSIAEHKAPGMEGSLLQNLGRRPLHVMLWGIAVGPDASQFVQDLNDKFTARQPVPFTADVVADAAVDNVVIQDLQVRELAGKPERYAFVLTLKESIKPVEPDDTSGVDLGILDDATALMDQVVSAVNIGMELALGLERFVPILSGLLGRVQQANKNASGAAAA
jgi:hypothetical protein